jgi:outer membrane protein assembly factor BamB
MADGTVYVGSSDVEIIGDEGDPFGNVYAIDAEDGTQQWAFRTSDRVRSSPAVVDNIVYVGCDDGSVYALTEQSTQETEDR